MKNPRDLVTMFREVTHALIERGESRDPQDIVAAIAIAATTPEWLALDARRERGENYTLVDYDRMRLCLKVMSEQRSTMSFDELMEIVDKRADNLTLGEYQKLRLSNEQVREHLTCLWQELNEPSRDIIIRDWVARYLYETKED